MMRESGVPSPHARALLHWAFANLGLTTAHHVYGAIRYDTPWRYHAAHVSVVVGSVLLVAFWLYRRRPTTASGAAAGWTLMAVALLFPVLTIGLFEGLYNHLIKNLLFLADAPRSVLLAMFPPPNYELPNDAWFEISGVLQVVPAALAARAAWRFVRALRGGRAALAANREGAAS